MPLLFAWALALGRGATIRRHYRIFVVPAPKGVVIDGDLSDWDLSAAIECIFDEALRPRFTACIAVMFDEKALYISAHFHDETPMLNRHDPAIEPDRGWDGDALQVRLCSDPEAPYPLPNSNSDRICHLTMWFFTDKRTPVLHIAYGMDYHGQRVWIGKEAGVAFRKDADGKGYTLEARIPWSRLNAEGSPPKAGDRIAFVVQPLWGDASGRRCVLTFNDVVRSPGFSFQSASIWGQAIFLPHGRLKPAKRPPTIEEELKPLSLSVPLPDPKAKVASVAIFSEDGRLVRTLGAFSVKGRGRHSLALRWDGLDDDGNPLPPGRYTVKVLTHRGIGQRYVTSLHNAGNPPWRTDDGTGSWGGDHGPPIAAASDERRVYLGWTISEAGWAIIAVDPKLPRSERVATHIGRKFWGQHQVLEIGIHVTALASDGERLFVAQDGKGWGADWTDPKIPNKAGVVIWDAETGRPLNFPFGKRVLLVSEWRDDLKPPEVRPHERQSVFHPLIPQKRMWERFQDHDFGPQELGLNLLGIAVSGDLLFASLYLEDKVVALNWRTGEKVREFRVRRPCGIAVSKDGSVLVVSGRSVVRINPRTGELRPVVEEGLSSPWGLALDKEGRIYVSDCGEAMCVKVFDPSGRLLRTIGRPGGRPWVGPYDPRGMLRPSGITVDREGKVWVCEHDNTPRRVSVWTREGRLVADLLGPGAYAVEGTADEANPRWVNVHHTLFEVDYATGRWKVLATLIRPQLRGFEFTPDGGFMGRALHFRHVKGQTFLIHRGREGFVLYRLGRGFEARPVCAMGNGNSLLLHGFTKEDLPSEVREELWRRPREFAFLWTDENGDGLVQSEELTIERVPRFHGLYWGGWLDNDLTYWDAGRGDIWRIPVARWLLGGRVPVYLRPSKQRPLLKLGDDVIVHSVLPDGNKVFVIEQEGGDAYGSRARRRAISCYTLDGERLWAYRRVWPGFGLEAPLSKPGDVVGAMKFIGKVKLREGLTIIGVNGYFGQFNLLSEEGLWVASLCKDKRYGPPADENVIWPENFSGFLFRNRENGKVYLMAGDTDLRIWEVTGLESIRTAEFPLVITPEKYRRAAVAVMRRLGLSPERRPIRLLLVQRAPKVDGDLSDWDTGAFVPIEVGGKVVAKAALASNGRRLFVAFDVADPSPMLNSGRDFALLFKTGDCCDLFLGTDPSADPRRRQPVAGDVRLLFSVMEGRPVCVLYEPVSRKEHAPRLFASPTGAEAFDRVVLLDKAEVAVRRRKDGYTLEAGVPLDAIGLRGLRPGTTLKGDVGVIFSDAAGRRDVLRLCYFNKETAVVDDVPTEARLEPGLWGPVIVEEAKGGEAR